MNKPFVSSIPIQEFALWEKIRDKRTLISFNLELTARCNNNCRHCYINIPIGDKKRKEKELSVDEIKEVAEQAVSLGALWCLITGGEPLLRPDFEKIYLTLKKLGLLVSVFTNATLINKEHIALFRKYPPRDIEVTIYGVTKATYERVTRKTGSFNVFMQGLDRLFKSGINVRLKAMAIRSNLDELPQIASFCRKHTKDYFRFDPFLHLRFDKDIEKNKEIESERLSPAEIVALEKSDPERFESLKKGCDKLIVSEFTNHECNHLFHCGVGNSSFALSYDGLLRPCSSLWHPDCVYDLKKGSLIDAWYNFILKIRDTRSSRREFLEKCRVCPLINLCLWCPAHAHLETGEMDAHVDYFCKVAHARADALSE